MGARVVYAVLTHHQPAHLGRLTRRLTADGARVVAHVDAKTNQRPFVDAAGEAVRFVDSRVRVHWGGFSMLRAMIAALAGALDADPEATHVQLLSGVDYPARPAAELLEAVVPGRSYLNFYPVLPGSQFASIPHNFCFRDQYALLPGGGRRAAYRLVDRLNTHLPDRTPPVPIYRGSCWMCLARPVAEYVVAAVRAPENRRLMRYFRTINVPDEIAFQTLVCNSPHADSLEGWDGGAFREGEKRVYLHYIDWSPDRENPAVLDLTDLPAIRASGRFFVRKVHPTRSATLMDALDAGAG